MAKFLDPLDVEEVTDTEDSLWRVIGHPFRYLSDVAGLISVPIGFLTDFASVPRIPFIYDALGNDANKPAMVHDWLYWTDLYPRNVADKVLLEAMGVIGMAWWRRWDIFLGVRIGGFVAWNNHRKLGHSIKDFAEVS